MAIPILKNNNLFPAYGSAAAYGHNAIPLAVSSIGTNFNMPNGASIADFSKTMPGKLPTQAAAVKAAPNIGGIMSAATTGLQMAGDLITDIQGKEYKQAAANYEKQMSNQFINSSQAIAGLNTNSSLMANTGAYNQNAVPTLQDNDGSTGGNVLKGASSGASAGMAFGPLGALIGGAGGGLISLAGQLFGNKRRKEANNRIAAANQTYNTAADLAYNNQITNVDRMNDKAAMSNYFDLGGSMIPTLSGAIGYELANKKLGIENLFALNLGSPNQANSMESGGSIHINPANKGKFNATKARTGKTTEELTHSSNPLTRKRAIFAQNAAKWNHHESGGNLNTFIPPQFQHGGVWNNSVENIGAGGSHAENPFGGVFMGVDQNGTPNLVEEGEVKWNDYIFSNKLKLDQIGATNSFLDNKFVDMSFSDIAKAVNTESEERPNDPVSKKTLNDTLSRLMEAQENERAFEQIGEMNSFASGGALDILRAAPIIGSGLATIRDAFGITNNRDYSNIDTIEDPPQLMPIEQRPITNYMQYVPLDRDYYTNRQAAQTAATREAVMNASNGNRGALMNTLTAVDFGGNIAEGALARQAQEADINQQMQVANFNRGTDMFNAQQAMQANAELLQAQRYNNQTRLQAQAQRAQMRDTVDMRSAAAQAANMSNFLQNMGSFGREQMAMNMINNNPGLYYSIGRDGSVTYKNGYDNLPKEQKAIVDAHVAGAKANGNKKKCGGKLNIKS